MPRLEEAHRPLYFMNVPQPENLVKARCAAAERLRILAGVTDADAKDTYREVNAMLRPALKRFGYRSLAEFEDSYERLGDMMPWPNH